MGINKSSGKLELAGVLCRAQKSPSSELWRLPARAQSPEEMFGWYSTHVARLVKVGCWRWSVAFLLTTITFNEDASHDEQECGAESTGQSNKDDKANGEMAA